MLVLTRKLNESIMIGDDIEVSVLAVNGDKVRLGIAAPKSVAIFRDEVYDQIHQGETPEPGAPEPGAGERVESELDRLKS